MIDELIATVAPSWALKRAQARALLRQYEAAAPSRLRTIRRSSRSIDSDVALGQRPIREAARWLDQNYDLALGALDALVRNVIGGGSVPEPLVQDVNGELIQDFNTELSFWHQRWAKAPEVTGEMNYSALQRLRALTLFREGEVFTQYLMGTIPSLQHGCEVPFSLELIDPDMVPMHDDASKGIVQGIRKTGWNRPTMYLVSKTVQGSATFSSYREVPADRMQHLKMTRRIGQTRGVSVFAAVLERLEDIRSYDESERIAAVIAASMAAAIKKGSPDLFNPQAMARDADGSLIPREHKFQPGMILDFLEVGEEVDMLNTSRPNPNLGRYRDDQLRAASAGIGPHFSAVSRNYEGTYSSRRQEVNEAAPHYAMLFDYLESQSEVPTWVRFVDSLVMARLIQLPRNIDLRTLYNVDYSKPTVTAIDRQKETNADTEALDNLQDTLVDVWRRNGRNPADMWRKLQDQATRLKDLQGVAPGAAAAASTAPAPAAPPPEDEPAPTEDAD